MTPLTRKEKHASVIELNGHGWQFHTLSKKVKGVTHKIGFRATHPGGMPWLGVPSSVTLDAPTFERLLAAMKHHVRQGNATTTPLFDAESPYSLVP